MATDAGVHCRSQAVLWSPVLTMLHDQSSVPVCTSSVRYVTAVWLVPSCVSPCESPVQILLILHCAHKAQMLRRHNNTLHTANCYGTTACWLDEHAVPSESVTFAKLIVQGKPEGHPSVTITMFAVCSAHQHYLPARRGGGGQGGQGLQAPPPQLGTDHQ